jgi:hypothetical protein
MKRDTLKTLAGLIIIGGIVVATFLYGNSQRQAQLKHDQDVKKQQAAKAQEQAKAATPISPSVAAVAVATPTPKPSVTPTPKPSASPQVAAGNNTAPVKSPATNTLQGSGGSGSALGTSTTASPAPVASPAVAAAASSNLPDTGPGTVGLIGLSMIAFMAWAVRGSRRAMFNAARSRRS